MDYPEFEDEVRGLKIALPESTSMPEAIVWLNKSGITESEILVQETNLNQIRQNFPLDSKFKELTKRNRIAVYSLDTARLPTIFLGEKSLLYAVRMGNVDRFIKISDADVRTALAEEFDRLVGSATLVELDVPPWSKILTQLEETVNTSTRKEFERLIRAAQIEELGALDEASVALIAAAQSGALLYDLGKWGEDVGLASKATFSRRKISLEEKGVIYTEKVPVDVGRPRERLKLANNLSGINIDIGIEDPELDISASNPPKVKSEADEDKMSANSDPDQTDEPNIKDQSAILSTIEEEIQNAIQLDR